MKKLLSTIMAVALLLSNVTYAKSNKEEAINIDVTFLDKKAYENQKQDFTMLDLRAYANRDFTDEVEGDGKGGWSDQGHNDMREFPYRGITELLGIPFDIIDPAANNNKSVMAIQGQKDSGVANRYEIPVGKTAAGMYVLHSSPWANGSYIGRYTFKYSDGTSAFINIIDSVHIADCYGNGSSDYYRAVWTGKNAVLNPLSLYLFALNNPHPDKEIESIVMETDGGGPYIMVVGITLTSQGPYLPMTSAMGLWNPSTDGWIECKKQDVAKTANSPIDMSYLVEMPAGTHGSLKATGSGFVFEDGTKAKFWGTNIVGRASFPAKEQAESISKRLAQNGFNLVRFSMLSEDFEKISDEDKSKLAYFVYCLKNNGIYSAVAGDRTKYLESFYDEQRIAKQEEFWSDLLSCKNNNSGGLLGNDFCMIEFIDGASMSDYNCGRFQFNAKDSKDELNQLFNSYVRSLNKSNPISEVWIGEYDINPWESVEKGTMEIRGCWDSEVYSVQKRIYEQKFLNWVQGNFYDKMNSVVKNLGVNALTTISSNSDTTLKRGDSYMGTQTDFVARTSIWQKPASLGEELLIPGWYDGTGANVKDKDCGIFARLADNRFDTTPYVISRWGTSMLNGYSAEMPVMMAAIAAQQGWTPIQYAFLNGEITEEDIMKDHYSIYNNPSMSQLMPAAASLYYSTNELSESKTSVLSEADIISENSDVKVSYTKMLSSKFSIKKAEYSKFDKRDKYDSDIIKNNGIYWDRKDGVFFAENDKVNAITGFVNAQENLDYFNIKPYSDFTTAVLTCLDGNTFQNANRLLLTLAGRSRNYSMSVNRYGHVDSLGEAKTLAENIGAEITLKLKGIVKVYALSESGERLQEINTTKNSSGYTVLDITEQKAISVNYEIECTK